jgi:hypothetical protein
MKKKLLLILLYATFSFGQTVGDYRSINSGDWGTLSSWEYYNGTTWVIPSGVSPQGYPGQFDGTHTISIQAGNTIDVRNAAIITQPYNLLKIDGTLDLNGNNGTADFLVNCPSLIVTPNLTPYATINFINKCILRLSENSSIQISTGGLSGDCSNNQSVYIGELEFSVCHGGGSSGLTFNEIMASGGSLNAIATSNFPICQGSTFFFNGSYTGDSGTGVNYSWLITDPNNITTTVDSQNTSVTQVVPGTYTAKLICNTIYNKTPFSNSETITAIVNPGETIYSPTATQGTGANCNEITANWTESVGATSYFLDVATDINFINFISDYNNLNVGNTLSKKIIGLTNGTTYYYRIYAANDSYVSPRSNTISYATLVTPNGLSATVTAQPTCTTVTGTVTLNFPYSQDPGYEYNVDGGTYQTSLVFSGLTLGLHSFTVRYLGENSCVSNPVIVSIANSPEIPIANAGSDFTKTCILNPSGLEIGTTAVPGVTYSWSPTLGLSDTTIANPIANPTTTTTYTLTTTQTAGGCTARDSVTTTVDTALPTTSAGADFTKNCILNTTGKVIGMHAETGITYRWSPATDLSDANVSNPLANPSATTTYTLTTINPSNGCSSTDSVIATVNTALPIADAGPGFTKTCVQNTNGNTIGTAILPDTFYAWSPTTGLSFPEGGVTTANPSVTTTYTLTATYITSGCTANDTVTVIVDYTLPIANAGPPFTKTCIQNPTGKEIGVTAESGTTYSWTPVTGLSDATASNPIANPSATTTYTLTATNSGSGCVATDTVEVTVYANQPIANAGADFTKSCFINPSGKTIGANALPLTSYSWSPSIGLSSATVSNPMANPTVTTIYTLTATSELSSCTTTDQVTVTVNTGAPVANAGADFFKTCTQNPAGATIGAAPVTEVTYSWSPTTNLSNASIANPIANPIITTTYTVTTTLSSNGCSSTDNVLVTVNTTAPIADAGADFTKTCTENPFGKSIGTASVAGNTYNWSPTTGLSSASISNPIANPTETTTYTLIVTNTANGCSATDQVIVTVEIAVPVANAGTNFTKTCTLNPTGTTIGVAAISNVAYSWSPATGLSPSASVSNPNANPTVTTTYFLTTTNALNGCTGTDEVTVTVDTTLPSAPIPATPTQPNCDTATGSVLLSGLPSGNWTITIYKNSVLNSTISGFSNTTSVNGLTAATYYFIVTITASGCTSPASANVVINSQPPTPTAPTFNSLTDITDPTCATGGSVVLGGLPSTGAWTLRQSGTSNAIIPGSGITTTILGLLPGTYQYVVVSNAGCISPVSGDVVMNVISSGATLGAVVHPTCATATGTITFNNLPTTGWILTRTDPDSSTFVETQTNPSPTTYTTPPLIAGIYKFVLNSGAICSAVGGNVTINTQPPMPLTPTVTVTDPTCGVNESTLAVNNLPAGSWTLKVINSIPSVIKTITGTGLSYSATGVFTAGNYTSTVTNDEGCTSPESLPFTIISQPPTPTVPTLIIASQPTCGVTTGNFTISNYNASYTYAITPSTGVNQSGNTVTAPTGTYTVTTTLGGCISVPSIPITINDSKVEPSAPIIGTITQPSCTSVASSVAISGLPTGIWTLKSSSNAVLIANGSGTTAFYTNTLPAGTYQIKVTNSDGCDSPLSADIIITTQPPTPVIPTLSAPSQPTCTVATGSFTIANYDSSNFYTVSPNTGVTVSGNTVTAPRGSYTVTATSGGCTSNASTPVEIIKQPTTPTAPIIANVTQPTCDSNTGSIELSGLPVGSWTLFTSPAIGDGTGLSGSGTTAILTGAVVGTYTITVKNSDGCTSSSSLPFTLNAQPLTPATPTVSIPIQPSCTVVTGSFTITNYNSSYNYKISPDTGVTLSGNTITAPTGIYTLTATLGNCISGTSSAVEISQQPITPTAPIIGNVVQPSCNSKTGSIEVSGLPTDAWTLYSSPEIIVGGPGLAGMGTTAFFTSVPSGIYALTVKNSDGCISSYSVPFTINTQPVTPAIPLVSSVTQPTCTVTTGSFRITNYDSNNTYTVTPNTGISISGDTITAPIGNYTVLATLGSCTSGVSEPVTINPQPTVPTAPIIDFVTQATCESNMGSIGLSGLPNESWILTSSGGRTLVGMGTTAIFNGNTVPGTYTVTVTNADSCTSVPSANIVLYAQPTIPNSPTVGIIIQPSCTIDTATIVISTPTEGTGYEYNIDGESYQTSATFSNVNTGVHKLTCRLIATGSCNSDVTIVEVKAPLLVYAPIVKSTIQPSCSTKGRIFLEGLPTGNWTLYQTGTTTETILGSGTTTAISGLEIGTYSYRVFDGTCLSKTTSNILLPPLQSTAWTGIQWTNDLPNIDKYVYMNGNYAFSKDTEMCSCQVITGFIHTEEGITITVADKLEILKGGNFSFANTSSLIQKNEVLNIGNINYDRFSAPVFQSDYVYWSSPVAPQRLIEASPNTPSDAFFSFDSDANNWKEEKPTSVMGIGKGYSIGSPKGFYEQNIYSYPIHFIGVPNNGTITTQSIDEGKSYLIGNPYPSAVNADYFLDSNKTVLNGTIYFWSHNPQSTSLPDASNDYASYNATGGVEIGPKDPVSNNNNTIPLGTIAAGQSFFAQGKNGVAGGIASFNNTMRIGGNNTLFFKFNIKNKSTDVIEKHRVWLNVYNDHGAFKQTLVGYVAGATNEYDNGFDGTVFNGNKCIDFYSINQNKKLTIQGRALPFDENDMVPLGFSTTIDGVFSISIDQTDGLFSNHEVYLEDKEAFVFYNLKKGPYRFNTSKGTFDNRFVIHYKNEIPSPEKLDHPVIVSVKDGVIKVNAFFEVIDKLKIYDTSGRLIYKQNSVNMNEYYIQQFKSSSQVLIVKTFLKNGDTVATKIVYTYFSN